LKAHFLAWLDRCWGLATSDIRRLVCNFVTPPLAFREGAEFGFGLLYSVDLDRDHAVNIDLFCFVLTPDAGFSPAPIQLCRVNTS